MSQLEMDNDDEYNVDRHAVVEGDDEGVDYEDGHWID